MKHYRLRHGHGGEFLPPLYWECYSSFKTWGGCEPRKQETVFVFLKIVISKQTFMEHLPLIGARNTPALSG